MDSQKAINPEPEVYAPDSELVQNIENLADRIEELSKDSPASSRQELLANARSALIEELSKARVGGKG